MIDTTGVAMKTITGEKMNPTGTLIEIPGMDGVSQRVCSLYLTTFNFK